MRTILFCCLALVLCQSTHAQTALRVEADSLKITAAELVIRNASKDTRGFLFNAGNGTTDFRKIGKAMQFSVGAPGFPQAGDSIYLNAGLSNRFIKVWRNGRLQKVDPTSGVSIDTTAGRIIFRPALINTEKIYIEAFNSNDFSVTMWYNGTLCRRRQSNQIF